jgi:Cys-tRNA synthase (O-phospho-L-seryl-tRNA:Cys-tRNA synthase)
MVRGPAVSSPEKKEVKTMELEIIGIVLGTVLPLYPVLFMIHQRIGRYDEVVEEFRRLQDEHEKCKEAYHAG